MSRYGHYGPRLGLPGYGSTFTRYTPFRHGHYYRAGHWYRPGFFGRHWYPGYARHWYPGHYYGYPYHRRGFSFSLGFGFYDHCYSYPSYPYAYYPAYYSPVYPAVVYPTYYASSVLVTTPTYTYVPEPVVEYVDAGYVSGAQYATAETYAGQAVEAPEVIYSDEYTQAYPQEGYAQAPPQEGYAQLPPQEGYTQGHVVPHQEPGYAEEQLAPQYAEPQVQQAEPAPLDVAPDAQYQQEPGLTPPPRPAEPAPQGEVVPPAEEMPADAAPAEGQAAVPPADEQLEELPELTPEQIRELQEMMVRGTESFNQGQYAEAARHFGEVAITDQRNVDAALAHAVAAFAIGEYAEAADSIRHGISLFPPIVDSLFDLRERYAKTGDFVNQVQRLEEHARSNPDDLDALVVLGFVRHFSDQRDLGNQAWQDLQRRTTTDDAELADVFLNAMPREEAEKAAAEAMAAAGTQPADGPGTLDVSVSRRADGVPTAQPGTTDGEVSPGVLSVSTRPAPMQKIDIPSAPIFDGKLSLTNTQVAREQTAVDGILVRLKGTDDAPPQAHLEINVGERRLKVRRFIPGAHVVVKGESGQEYRLVLTEVDNATETISYMVDPQ